MIPRANVTAWRAVAPWPTDAQVEQDLVLSRALVEMFNEPRLQERVAFRGGTALHKLLFDPPGRYSEDIDLVATTAGAAGDLFDPVRAVLDPWLGEPRRKRSAQGVTMIYRFETTALPVQRMRLKVEINVREREAILGYRRRPLQVENPWFSGKTELVTFAPEELLGTKLRALYQRKKGRDLFDLDLALRTLGVDEAGLVECFGAYMAAEGHSVSRAEFERSLSEKLEDEAFIGDVVPLMGPDVEYDVTTAAARVHEHLVARLPGDPWRGVR